MGAAVQKSSPQEVRLRSASPRTAASDDAPVGCCTTSNSPTTLVSSEGGAALPATAVVAPRGPRVKPAMQITAPNETALSMQQGTSAATPRLEATSTRPHLSAPRSPLSISRLSGDSPARRTPSHNFVRRPTLTSLNATTAATNAAGTKPTGSPLNEHSAVVTPLRRPTSGDAASAAIALSATKTLSVQTAAAAAAAPAASPASPNSSCSAFSLYSAESSLRELPPLPAHLLASETILIAATPAATTSTLATTRPPLTPLETARGGGVRPPTAATASAAPAASLNLASTTTTAAVAVEERVQSVATAAASLSASARLPLLAPASPPSTPAYAPTYANFLLDMSFDSRVLTAGAASASAEIHRIGTRLQRYQRGPALSSPQRLNPVVSFTNPTALCEAAALTSSANFSPTETELLGKTVPQPRLTPLPAISSSVKGGASSEGTATAGAAQEKEGERAVEPLYLAETVKFVDVIQRLQRARDAGRVSYTWFRPEALQASEGNFTKSSSSAVCHRGGGSAADEDASTAPSRSSSGDNAQSSSGITGRERQEEDEEEEDRGVADVETERRASMRRRDRLSRLIHWVPYETHECDPLTPLRCVPVSLCGFPAASATGMGESGSHGAAAAASTAGRHSEDAGGDAERIVPTHEAPLLSRGEETPFTRTDTPPLPTVINLLHPTKQATSEGEKLSAFSADANASNPTTSTATSVRFNSVDSLSHCPAHVTFRPPSIYIMHHWERSRNATGPSSPAKRQHLVSGQVAVPASAVTTPRPSATPLPAVSTTAERRTEGRLSESNLSCSHSTNHSSPGVNSVSSMAAATASASTSGEGSGSGVSGRRAIIDGQVPYRKQLAKKALEENKLFFEFVLRRQTTRDPPGELLGEPSL